MCIYEEKDFEKYETALNSWFQVDKAAVGPKPPPTLQFDDGFEPITHMWEYRDKVGITISDSTGRREVDDGSAQLSRRLSKPIYIYMYIYIYIYNPLLRLIKVGPPPP